MMETTGQNDFATRYSEAKAGFDSISEVVKELYQKGIIDNDASVFVNKHIASYHDTCSMIDGYLDSLQQIAEPIERITATKSIDNKIEAINTYRISIQNKLKEIMISDNFTQKNSVTHEQQPGSADNSKFMLFAGCDTVEKIKRRYKELSKNYHPDTDSGNEEAMQAINTEYERLLKIMEI